MTRATIPVLPPGGNGTTRVIGRVGKVCARAAPMAPMAPITTDAAATAAKIILRMLASSRRMLLSRRVLHARVGYCRSFPVIKEGGKSTGGLTQMKAWHAKAWRAKAWRA
jgi:hypothetical protein